MIPQRMPSRNGRSRLYQRGFCPRIRRGSGVPMNNLNMSLEASYQVFTTCAMKLSSNILDKERWSLQHFLLQLLTARFLLACQGSSLAEVTVSKSGGPFLRILDTCRARWSGGGKANTSTKTDLLLQFASNYFTLPQGLVALSLRMK